MPDDARLQRIQRVIGGVLREALRTTGARGIVLREPDSPEGVLVRGIAAATDIPLAEPDDAPTRAGDLLTAHPANKTTLLAGSVFPQADLLPLGDLYATQVRTLAGDWTGDASLHDLAKVAGGIDSLDDMLRLHVEGRCTLDVACVQASAEARAAIAAALARTRFRRARAGLVPKLGGRTVGIDLLD